VARLRRHFLWVALGLSILVHFAPVTGPKLWRSLVALFQPRATTAGNEPGETENKPLRRTKEEIQAARKALVDDAMAKRKAGKLVLGRFVLDADALDAEEDGSDLDSARARQLYEERKQKLSRALERAKMPRAVELAFDDLEYSTAVNRMSQLLLTKVGACGPTAQLMVAAAYDLGERQPLRLRYWGGVNDAGATHLTATWKIDGTTHDLATGAPVLRGGVEFPADELIEAYARAHDLLPRLAGAMGAAPDVDETARSRFSYPPNEDAYIGDTPIFAEARKTAPAAPASAAFVGGGNLGTQTENVALTIPSDPELWRSMSWPLLSGTSRDEDAGVCVLDPRARDPKSVAVIAESGATSIQVIPVLPGSALAYIAKAIARYERIAPKKTEQEKVLRGACLALSYHWAAERFVAAGYEVIGNEAARRGERHREKAEKILAELRKLHGEALSQQFPPGTDHWALIALEDGQNVLLEVESKLPLAAGTDVSPYWSQDRRTRALLLEPKTRQRLLDAAPTLPLAYRMHLIGAIASLELSGSDLDLPKVGFIAKAYAAYRAYIDSVRTQHFDSDVSLDKMLDVLRAAGATEKELAEKRLEIDELKRQLRQRGLRVIPPK
jgi:hypothetical protein